MGFLYDILYLLGFLLYLPRALWRRRLPHRGWSMRLGRYPAHVTERLGGRRAVWVHAVSVGEVLAVQPLLQALLQAYPQDPLVVSTITTGGFEVATKLLGACGVPIYFPLDLAQCVAQAFDIIRPRALLLVESELWPGVIRLAKARGVPMALVNGRISPRTFHRYWLVRPWIAGTLRRVDLCLMQSQQDADRLLQLGVPREAVRVTGSLKWDAGLSARPSPEAIGETATHLGLNGRQAVIVAGSTHRGEETLILQAFLALRAVHQDARLIIAPRHLERVEEVEGEVRRAGLRVTRCSSLSGTWDVGLIDRFGELPRYYGLATVVFIGGSLIPHGGQNPLEAASLGRPVVFGPSMHNFSEITQRLLERQAALQLTSRGDLLPALKSLMANPAARELMGRRAQETIAQCQGATQKTLELLRPLLIG